ncbi:MAG: AsmA family protein [Nitrospirae bacterium]|nr:AsmA family protein [Nitrospirota bacterium]
MKKIFLLIIAAITIIVITLIFFIKTYVTPERIKTFLIPYAEQTLNRKISIGEIKINLLKGIVVKDFAVKETDEKTDFVKCRDFILKFQLLPLLSRKVVIDELKILSPEVRISRNNKGRFNFEDIGEKEKTGKVKEEKQPAETQVLPISLLVNNISAKDSSFSFTDSTKGLPDIKGSFAIYASIKSADGAELFSEGKIDAKFDEIVLQTSKKEIKNIKASLNYSTRIDLESKNIRIDKAELKIQKILLLVTGMIKSFGKEPEIDITVSVPKTKSADLQKLITSFTDMKGLALSDSFSADLRLTGKPQKLDSLKSNGEIKMKSLTYKSMTVTDFYTKYTLKDSKFEIVKMTAAAGNGKLDVNSVIDLSTPEYVYSLSGSIDSLHVDEVVNSFFPKAKDTVFGLLSLNLKLNGSGTLPENIKKNLVADGDFNIKDGKITNAKIADNLSVLLKTDELKTINMKQANGTVKIRNSAARLDSMFLSDDISMNPSGHIGLDESLDLVFDLKLSPRLSKKALGSGVAKYIKDEEGWGIIPMKVSGTFSDPSYSVDVAKAGTRVIEKGLIDKLFKKDKGRKRDKTQEDKKPVEDLLKGIFR